MNLTSALDPLLRFTRNRATPNLPSVLTPPFNPNAGSAVPATLEQARAAMPQVATPPNPATTPRPVALPGPAPDMPVPAIRPPQMPKATDPSMTETRRVGAPMPEKQQVLPLAKLSSLPQPLPLEAPKNADGTMLAARPDAPAAPLEVPKARSKFWDTLKGIGYGAMLGASKTGGNPWGLLGGAAAGGIGTFKAPSNVDTLQYEAITRPREQADALEQYQRDKMGNDIALGKEKAQTEREDRETRRVAAETNKQREERLAKEAQARLDLQKQQFEYQKTKPIAARPVQVQLPDGRTVVMNANTREELGAVPQKEPKPMSAGDAAAELDVEEGSVDQIANDSLQGRTDSLWQKLTPREQAFASGNLPPKLEDQNDMQYQSELAAAGNKWQKIQQDEKTRIVQETTRTRRAGVNARIAASKGRAPAATQPAKGKAAGSTIKASEAAELFRKLKGQ